MTPVGHLRASHRRELLGVFLYEVFRANDMTVEFQSRLCLESLLPFHKLWRQIRIVDHCEMVRPQNVFGS
jgi:hypothetical protein